jgi:polar amino acid transport system permease protein
MTSVVDIDTSSAWSFFVAILPLLLNGLVVTLGAAALGYVIAVVMGLVLAILCRSRSALISLPVKLFLEFVRDTPLLIQLFFLYYALPAYGIRIPGFAVGVIAIGLQYSAYLAEVYRGGIEAIPSTQWDSALSLRLSRWQTYRDIILPQVLPRILPTMGNYLASIMKETPILSTISVFEMFSMAIFIGDRTYRYAVPLTTAAIMMLGMTSLVSLLVSYIERRLPRRGISMR